MLEMLLGVGKKSSTVPKAAPLSRQNGLAAAIDGKIYLFGGTGASNVMLGDLQCYTPETDTWETKASGPVPRRDCFGGAFNGKLYIHGGYNAVYGGALKDTWCYDTATDVWTQKSNSPVARLNGSSGMLSTGRLVVSSGVVGNAYADTTFLYNVLNDTWSQAASFTQGGRQYGAGVGDGQKFYCYGGLGPTGYANDFLCYDSADNSWKNLNAPPGMVDAFAGKMFVYKGKIYIHGGRGTNLLSCYDPEKYTWTSVKIDKPLTFHYAIPIGDKLYVGSGSDPFTGVLNDKVWMLTLD